MVFNILTNFVQYDTPYLSYHQNTKWLVTFCEQSIALYRLPPPPKKKKKKKLQSDFQHQ